MGFSDFGIYGSAMKRIKRSIAGGMISHAYIIEGNQSIDKEGFANAFAAAVLCKEEPGEGCGYCADCRKVLGGNYEDLYNISPKVSNANRSATASVKDDDIEKLQSRLNVKPSAGERNIAIISGADTMTLRAQNRLLKTLEEPTPGTIIMLLVENTERLIDTIRSRCVEIKLHRDIVSDSAVKELAVRVLDMIASHAFYYDIKTELEGNIKSRPEARAFVDGLEQVLGEYLRKGTSHFDIGKITAYVGICEQARMALQANANVKYVLKNLIVKLEEI